MKAHHLCCCINISNLHLMGSWTVLLDPVPSELMAWHWYKPLSCRLTFCKTKLWLVIITPSSKLYFNGLPCNKTMKKSLKLSNILVDENPCQKINLDFSPKIAYFLAGKKVQLFVFSRQKRRIFQCFECKS